MTILADNTKLAWSQPVRGMHPYVSHADLPRSGLAALLRERTAGLHRQAEQSGIVRDILRGQVSRTGYALYLRNLLPAYQKMEQALLAHRLKPGVRLIALPALFRASSIERDLDGLVDLGLSGGSWRDALPLLAAGERYAARIAAVDGRPVSEEATALIGHAYTRYLGDLSGAQLLKRSLARVLELGPETLAFYDFPAIPDLASFKQGYRDALDRAGLEIGGHEGVLAGAIEGFACTIEVAEAVAAAIDQEKISTGLSARS